MRILTHRTIVAALAGAAFAILPGYGSTAQAALFVADTFTQPDGTPLAGTSPQTGGAWAAHSGSTFDILINGGAANVNESAGVQDDHSNFDGGGVAGPGAVLYSSFTINVPTPTTLTPVYFAMFLAGTVNFTSRVWVNTPATSGDGYRVTLSQGSSVTAAGVVNSQDLAFGTTYTIMTSYNHDNKNGSLWIGTTDPNSTPIGTTSDAGFSDPVDAYAFRQSKTTGNVSISVDNLNVSGDLPEPASIGILGIGSLLLRRRCRRS